MTRMLTKIKEEIIALIPPTLFFFIALHFVALLRSLMVEQTGIKISTSVSVTVAALILGKSVLIADLLPFINRHPQKPLIYNIAWKTTIYFLVAMFIHYLERLVDFWRDAGGLIAGNQKLIDQMVWSHFWAVNLLLVFLILNYCTLRELARVLGEAKMRQIFFGPLPEDLMGE